jgi:hypothetical protein
VTAKIWQYGVGDFPNEREVPSDISGVNSVSEWSQQV